MHLVGWPIVALVVAALVAEIAMIVLLTGERDYTGRIYPNIHVRGVDVGNRDFDDAHRKLESRYASFLFNPVELRYHDKIWQPTASDLGIAVDFGQAIRDAAAVGRTASRADNTQVIATVWENGLDLPLYMTIDTQVMQNYLLSILPDLEEPPINADVELNADQIVVSPEQPGTQVLIDETINDIIAAVQTTRQQRVVVRTRPIFPMVRDGDLSPILAKLHTMLEEPIQLISTHGSCIDGCQWTWDSRIIAQWLDLSHGRAPDGRPTVDVQISHENIRSELEQIASAVRQDGNPPRVNWNNGNLTIFQYGTEGLGLDIEKAVGYIDNALKGGPRSLVLPMIAIPPPVHAGNIHQLGINDLVGVGVSSFRASQAYRITNIQAGSRRMHGVLIPPDGAFSFNQTLGKVDASGGFVQGSAIVNDRTQQEWGGGLCQVSTTMFRAAFWGGMPILERHEHNFRIGWYEELGEPPGLDAAIYTGALDLRFRNNTGGWLLIQSWVDLSRQRLTIALYGKSLNRTVNMSHRIIGRTPAPTKPMVVKDSSLPAGVRKQTDWAQPGLQVEVYRDVWQDGQLLRRETFPTTFKPWPNIFVEGTGR